VLGDFVAYRDARDATGAEVSSRGDAGVEQLSGMFGYQWEQILIAKADLAPSSSRKGPSEDGPKQASNQPHLALSSFHRLRVVSWKTDVAVKEARRESSISKILNGDAGKTVFKFGPCSRHV
jgi:hypothetical protein